MRITTELAKKIEQSLRGLSGITDVQVDLDEAGNIAEIWACGPAIREAKQVVRDIETVVRVRYHLPCDYRKISLAQIQPAECATCHTPHDPASMARVGDILYCAKCAYAAWASTEQAVRP